MRRCIVALVLGCAAVAAPPFEHGARTSRNISLTLDACSSKGAIYDEPVIQVLIDTQTEATLFLGGLWMEKHPDAAKKLAANPLFELANHGYWHLRLVGKSDEMIQQEIRRTQQVFAKLLNLKPTLFRAPYGEVTAHVNDIIEGEGLRTIQFDMATGDADKQLKTQAIINDVLARTHGGSVLVAHMNGNGHGTAEILKAIIPGLRAKGYRFVKTSQLLE